MTTIHCHTCDSKQKHILGEFGIWECQVCGAQERQITRKEWAELTPAV